jgi:hypothetical protein
LLSHHDLHHSSLSRRIEWNWRIALIFVAIFSISSSAHAGHWAEPEYTYTGTASAVWPNGRTDQNWATGSRTSGGPFGLLTSNGSPFSAETSGQIKVTIRWVPDDADDAPPASVVLRESATVRWHGMANPISTSVLDGQADNGLGHPQVVTTEGNTKTGISTGRRSVRVPVSSNDCIERTVNLSGSFNATINQGSFDFPIPYYGNGGIDTVSYSAKVVNRWVSITSALDTTYRREMRNGLPVRLPNDPDEYFTIHADTVGNGDTTDFFGSPELIVNTYNGNHWGPWSQESFYTWNWTLGFQPPNHAAHTPRYGQWWPLFGTPSMLLFYTAPDQGMPEQTAQVHLNITDREDAEYDDAYYYLKFHHPYEDIVILNQQILPTQPNSLELADYPNGPEGWTWFESFPGPATTTVTHTAAVEIGGEVSVEGGGGSEAFKKMLALKTTIKVTAKQTKTLSVSQTFGPLEAGYVYHFYWSTRKLVADGTASEWGVSGYVRDVHWNAYETQEGLRLWYLKTPIEQ